MTDDVLSSGARASIALPMRPGAWHFRDGFQDGVAIAERHFRAHDDETGDELLLLGDRLEILEEVRLSGPEIPGDDQRRGSAPLRQRSIAVSNRSSGSRVFVVPKLRHGPAARNPGAGRLRWPLAPSPRRCSGTRRLPCRRAFGVGCWVLGVGHAPLWRMGSFRASEVY